MRRFLVLPVMLIALTLGGCAGTKLGDLYDAATATFTNPATPTTLYQAEVIFEGSQKLVLKYQHDCFGSNLPPYPISFAMIKADPVLSIQCNHRFSRYNVMKAAEDKAFTAISLARVFIINNPTGNATSYISAAISAVIAYRGATGG